MKGCVGLVNMVYKMNKKLKIIQMEIIEPLCLFLFVLVVAGILLEILS